MTCLAWMGIGSLESKPVGAEDWGRKRLFCMGEAGDTQIGPFGLRRLE